MAVIDLRNQINNSIHHLVMEYNFSETEYGINKVPMVIMGGSIWKAKVESVPSGKDPLSFAEYWQNIAGYASVDKQIVYVNASYNITVEDAGKYFVCNTTLAPIEFTLPKISDLDDGFTIGFSVYGDNSATLVLDDENYIANDMQSMVILDKEKYEILADTTAKAWVITMQEVRNLPDNGSYSVGFIDRDGRLILEILNMQIDRPQYDDYNMENIDGEKAFVIADKVNLNQKTKTKRGIEWN
jgi:hypothetical protein